jgi:hypothetical protein
MNLPLKASMDFGRNTPKRTCMIRNSSEGGARLHVGFLLDPPEYFDLLIPSVGNFSRRCKLAWRSEFDIGVKFVPRNCVPVDHKLSSSPAGGTHSPEPRIASRSASEPPCKGAPACDHGERGLATFGLSLRNGFVVVAKSITRLIDLAQHPHSALKPK